MSHIIPRIDFYTARDGQRLAARVWGAIEPPRARARLVFLHGITSHGGWYYGSCHHLNTRGYEVHFLDRRGSGLNAEGRGDVDRYETWIDDVAVYLEQLRGDRPVVLGGISWGGKLATAVARRHAGLLSGLALLCPGIYSQFEPKPGRRLVLAARVPQRTLARQVAIPLRQASLFTDTPRWIDYVNHDPLALRDVTFRFAREDRRLTRLARESAPYIDTPTLMMLGGRDRIVANHQTRAFLSRTAAAHKTLIEYRNAAHTLEFENEPEPYFADLADWIGRTVAT